MGLFSGLFGGSKQTTTSSIPKWMEAAGSNTYNKAEALTKKPYEAYGGQTYAGKNDFYDKAASALGSQRDLAGGAFNKSNSILNGIARPNNNYYDDVNSALNSVNPLTGNMFGGASTAAGNVKSLTGDYFADADAAAGNMRALTGDYFADADNALKGVNRGAGAFAEAEGRLNQGSTDFKNALGRSNDKIGSMASRGSETSGAIGQFGQLPGMVSSAQKNAENIQLGTNSGLRSTLGGAMGESGSGYDEAAGLTRKAAGMDATNGRAINERMNPYTEAVTGNILRDYNKERQVAGKGLTDAARSAGAFGGSRHGVAQGMFDQETSKGTSDIVTTQREKNYQNAVTQLGADRNNLLASSGQLSGIQQARDAGTLGFTGQISDMAGRDADLLRQGGLDLAGATKDSASGRMGAERQLFDMDADTAKMLQDLGRSYSDESIATSKAKLDSQNLRFGQDMSFAQQMDALGKSKLAQQAQEFGQNTEIFNARDSLGKNRLNQQQQKYAQDQGIYQTQADLAKNLLAQQQQGFSQGMDKVSAKDAIAKGQLSQEQQRLQREMGLADAYSNLGQVDQKSWQAMAADLLGYGKEVRGIDQGKLNDDKAKWDEKQQYDYEQLNWLTSILAGQPYSKASTTTSKDSPGNSILGAITGGLGAILSDENEKEARSDADLEQILEGFRSMPVDDYDYKQRAIDSGAAPEGRRTGPMAQDWQSAFGGNGREIDVGQMLGKLAGAVKGLEERTRDEPRGNIPRRKVA